MKYHKTMTHQVKRTYKCYKCDKTYDMLNDLKAHTSEVHDGLYACDICDKVFKSLETLKKHKFIVHENEKNHMCEVCGKAFHFELRLKKHVQIGKSI